MSVANEMDCRVQCQDTLSSQVVLVEETGEEEGNERGEEEKNYFVQQSSTSSSSPPVVVVVVPSFTFRKPSTSNNEFCEGELEEEESADGDDGDEGVGKGRRKGRSRRSRHKGEEGSEVAERERGGMLEAADTGKAFLLIHSVADVCRICQCGPNTLATPTPLLLTPVTSPKKRFSVENSTDVPTSSSLSSAVNTVVELKRSSLTQHQDAVLVHHPSPEKQQKCLSPDYNLISPCVCSGSLKYVHQCCLQNWIRASNNTTCELCKHPFHMRSKFKPLWKWEALPMVPGEKKRIVCSALFHTVALACVVWSLYVLIDRTVEELNQSDLEWQFWTKIIVEAIGCLGAGILTYVWGKSYIVLLIRWITFNRSFVIIGRDNSHNVQRDPNQRASASAAAATTHNNESAVEQELINLIN